MARCCSGVAWAEPAKAAEAAKPAALAPSSDTVDLRSLGLDPAASTYDDELNLYGFADFGFILDRWQKYVPGISQRSHTFFVGNLNLYIAKNLSARARGLAEIRFSFAPNGGRATNGQTIDTSTDDVTNLGRPTQWGGIVLERAYLDYDLTETLTVRAGRWLTPYGIWNIDHGSPVIITTGKPYVIGEAFFPQHQTGLELYGHYDVSSSTRLTAHATMTNGRSSLDAIGDPDDRVAFGGRLELETSWGLRAGASYYAGRATWIATSTPEISYREAAYGGDAQYDRDRLHLQAEVLIRDRHFASEADADLVAERLTLDNRDFGFYALVGYRFPFLWNVMPFGYFEYYEPANTANYDYAYDGNVGLNFRPTPSFVLKTMAQWVKFHDDAALFQGSYSIELTAQAAWMF